MFWHLRAAAVVWQLQALAASRRCILARVVTDRRQLQFFFLDSKGQYFVSLHFKMGIVPSTWIFAIKLLKKVRIKTLFQHVGMIYVCKNRSACVAEWGSGQLNSMKKHVSPSTNINY
jgi:hypothetical protein